MRELDVGWFDSVDFVPEQVLLMGLVVVEANELVQQAGNGVYAFTYWVLVNGQWCYAGVESCLVHEVVAMDVGLVVLVLVGNG